MSEFSRLAVSTILRIWLTGMFGPPACRSAITLMDRRMPVGQRGGVSR